MKTDIKSSTCARTLWLVTKSALPFDSIILPTASLSKKQFNVFIPASFARSAGALAGSTPQTSKPSFLNSFRQVPSFEPMSTIRESCDRLHFSVDHKAYS